MARMTKKFTSVALALMMCIFLAVPVFAAPATVQTSEYGNLVPYSEVQPNGLVQAGQSLLDISAPVGDESEVSTNAATVFNSLLIRQIIGYPLIHCLEDNGLYYFDGIRAIATWTSTTSMESLRLTSAQVASLYSQVNNAILDLNDGKTYGIVGWRMWVRVETSAENPINVKWTPTGTCLSGQGEHTVNIPYKSTVLTLDEMFLLPENYSDYYRIACGGAFYFSYPNGSPGSIMMSAGISVNTDKVN